MEEKRKSDLKQEALLQGLKKKPNITLDGREIKVYANIGSTGDVGLVLQNGAQGIGLFRSEFVYLDSKDYPSEDTQFAIYKRVAETMPGRRLLFVLWTLVRTNRLIILGWTKRITRHWAIARSESA